VVLVLVLVLVQVQVLAVGFVVGHRGRRRGHRRTARDRRDWWPLRLGLGRVSAAAVAVLAQAATTWTTLGGPRG